VITDHFTALSDGLMIANVDDTDISINIIHNRIYIFISSRGELSCSALPVALPFYLTELRKVGA